MFLWQRTTPGFQSLSAIYESDEQVGRPSFLRRIRCDSRQGERVISYPLWLAPNGSVICAVIRLSLRLDARVRKHTPMRDSAQEGYLTPERGQIMAKNAARARAARRAQQLAIPETYDDALGRS